MSTAGHFITLVGIFFFFFMLLDSNLERRVFILSTLGIPRFYKRVSYYIFKLKFIKIILKKLSGIPGMLVRLYILNNSNFEFECFK